MAKKLVWKANEAYVGKLCVGKIMRFAPTDAPEGIYAEMLNDFGLSPFGEMGDMDANLESVRRARAAIEANWAKIVGLMESEG